MSLAPWALQALGRVSSAPSPQPLLNQHFAPKHLLRCLSPLSSASVLWIPAAKAPSLLHPWVPLLWGASQSNHGCSAAESMRFIFPKHSIPCQQFPSQQIPGSLLSPRCLLHSPSPALGHCSRGSFAMLPYKAAHLP